MNYEALLYSHFHASFEPIDIIGISHRKIFDTQDLDGYIEIPTTEEHGVYESGTDLTDWSKYPKERSKIREKIYITSPAYSASNDYSNGMHAPYGMSLLSIY